MKKLFFIIPCIALVMACGNNDEQYESQVAVPVTVEDVKRKPIEEFFTTTGTVKAVKDASLRAESEGYYELGTNPLTGRPFVLGDRARKGQTIITLVNPEVENNVKIESIKLNLDITKREFENQKSLYEKGGVTLRELTNAERDYIDAKYAHDNALISLSKLKVQAPFDGVIVSLPYYTQGTKISSNSPLVELMNYERLYLEISLPGKEIGRVKPGQTVRVMNYTLPEDTLSGSITQVSPALDPQTRSFQATVNVDNPEWLLRPGMFVNVSIVLARKDTAIVIPKDIILSQRRGKTVYVVERGAAERRIIQTGLENQEQVEVVSGLKEDERLVVKGFETLQDHSKVKVIR
ncbi:efflux RND transporter periplasmic adaptor subunit [candidate division KSB1 bacterium]|nr:efflux RND transporter periplasmic adaptor subunit [candidate division KSB1 bacterium]